MLTERQIRKILKKAGISKEEYIQMYERGDFVFTSEEFGTPSYYRIRRKLEGIITGGTGGNGGRGIGSDGSDAVGSS